MVTNRMDQRRPVCNCHFSSWPFASEVAFKLPHHQTFTGQIVFYLFHRVLSAVEHASSQCRISCRLLKHRLKMAGISSTTAGNDGYPDGLLDLCNQLQIKTAV